MSLPRVEAFKSVCRIRPAVSHCLMLRGRGLSWLKAMSQSVCMHVCVWCVCVCVYMYVHAHKCIYSVYREECVCVCASMFVLGRERERKRKRERERETESECVCVCVCVCVCACSSVCVSPVASGRGKKHTADKDIFAIGKNWRKRRRCVLMEDRAARPRVRRSRLRRHHHTCRKNTQGPKGLTCSEKKQ